jgi:branched-chain amino acid transport system substrate-binding protein
MFGERINSMRTKILVLAVCVFALVAVLGGCNSSKQAGNTIKIGVITSLTGSNAAFGQAHKAGYTIAANEINAKGGLLGKKIELDFYDDQSKPDQAVQGVSKLVDQDHVPVILGAYSSESTRAIIPVITQKQIPVIVPTAVADNIMETGSKYVFRICAGSGSFASATLDFLKNNGDPKRIAVVYENTNFGQSNLKSMQAEAAKAGVQLVSTDAYQASSPDYKALLQRVKSNNPDAIYFASYLLDASTLMRQAEQVNLNPKYYTSAGTGFAAAEFPTADKGAGKYAEYTFSVSQWLPSARWKGSKEFDDAYFKQTGLHPAYHGMEAYASLIVAGEAITKAGKAEAPAVADALRALDIPETPFGPVKFNEKGQNAHPVLLTQVQNAAYKVVWPLDAAEAKAILPTPEWSKRAK